MKLTIYESPIYEMSVNKMFFLCTVLSIKYIFFMKCPNVNYTIQWDERFLIYLVANSFSPNTIFRIFGRYFLLIQAYFWFRFKKFNFPHRLDF